MDRRQIATKLVMDVLGGINTSSFNHRLALQKTIYILQTAGVNLGYRYSWYLRGPYSRELAADAYSIREELDATFDESEGWKLDDQSTNTVERLKPSLTETPREFNGSLSKWLEVLASVLFLIHTEKTLDKSPPAIKLKLDSFNKQFSESEIQLAMNTLSDVSLI